MRLFAKWLAVAWLLVTATACQDSTSPGRTVQSDGAEGNLTIYVVNYPLQYFAERIGGEHVEVVFPAPSDVDPAYWSPDAEIIAAYQRADLILLNGAGYARWVARASLPRERMVDTGAAFADRLVMAEDAVTHTHGPEGAHEHSGFAFTTWLDPTLASEQAEAVARALEKARPSDAATFRRAFDALAADLAQLDRRLAAVGERLGSEPLLFSHPVYQYLIRRYDLNGWSLHWEPEQPPDLAELARVRKEHPARWLIWESEPLPGTVAALQDVGVASVVFAPCGQAPDTGDLISVMERNVSRLEAIAEAASR